VDLCKRILASTENNLSALGKLSIKQLMEFKGIGEAKAISIVAALELGRRRRGEEALQQKKIESSHSVFELMQPIIGELPHEEFWIVYLNNSNKVIHKNQLSKGGITGTLVDVRLVMKTAIEVGATGLILAHNHPSGTLKPSEADKQITKKLKTAAESLDIKVLDHLIVTEKAYFSFADENIL
jgi:DNA repair protein RadC